MWLLTFSHERLRLTLSRTQVILAIPFDANLLKHGIHRVIALHMVQSHQLTLAQAAKLADMDLSSFIELLGASGIDAVDYPPEELERELEDALAACDHC